MPTDQFSVKTTPEAISRFESEFQEAKAQNPELTKGQFFDQYTARQSSPTQNADPVDMSQYMKVEDVNSKFESVYSILRETLNMESGILPDIVDKIKATQQRAMMALQTQEQKPLSENEILFTIPEPHLSILKETTKRLSEYLKTTVTIADLFLDMAIRYECERNEEWFYPHLIRKSEFKAITGYTYDELNAFIKRQK